MRARRLTLSAVVLTLVASGAASAEPRPSSGHLISIGAEAAADLQRLPHLGRLDPGHPLTIGVALRHPDPAGEERAAAGTSDATSPSYRHFWTPAEWQHRFGPQPSVAASALRWLTRDGLTVTWSAYDYLLLHGTTAQVERTFSVSMQRFSSPTTGDFYAAAGAARVPDYVGAVLGLSELERFHVAQDTCAPGVACVGTLSPRDLWSIYDQPAEVVGHGQRVGVLGQGAWTGAIKDLRIFEREQKLPKVNVRVVPVNNPNTDTTNQTEWDIDTQASTGMAPGVDELVLYFPPSLAGSDMTAAMSAWANDPEGPNQVDASFGGCESLNLALNEIGAEEPVFRQASAEGRTLFVSTGDTGGSCTVITGNGFLNTGAPQVEWPSSSPHVVSVGGTQLYDDAGNPPHRKLEKAWEYTGGGTSYVMPAPDWQKKIAVITGRCTVGMDGQPQPPGTVCRGLPDVAAVSGDIATNGYAIVNAGQDSGGGGTSLSSPLWVGMWARIQAAAPLVSGQAVGLGFAPPQLYGRAFQSLANAADFFDIAVGGNGQYAAIPANPADPTGWDYVTGLGAPVVRNLMLHLTGHIRETLSRAVPARPDRVVAPGLFGCRADGSLVDDSGDAFGAFSADADITSMRLSSDGRAVTFVMRLPGLADNPDVLNETAQFRYDGVGYDVAAQRTKDATLTAFYLDKYDSAGTSSNVGSLQGTYDFVRHEIRVVMDFRTFNGDAKPRHDLKPGAVLAVGTVDTSADFATSDTIPSPGCPYRVR